MKVAFNNCFGGFGLSNLALTELAKKKGITLTWYEQVGYKHQGNELYKKVEGVPTGNDISMKPLIEDVGDEITELPSGAFYYPDFYDDESRCDKDLIDVIEAMGDEADGMCADLCIAEIPDGASFEITEYDGNESVEPPRMSW